MLCSDVGLVNLCKYRWFGQMWEFNGQYLEIVVTELITVDIHLDRRLALTHVFRPENVGDIGTSTRMYDIGIISVLIWFPGKSEYPLTCGNPDSREPGYRFTSHSLIGRGLNTWVNANRLSKWISTAINSATTIPKYWPLNSHICPNQRYFQRFTRPTSEQSEETSAQERVGNSSILRNASGGPENYYSAVRTSSEKSDSTDKKSETVRTTTVSWADIVTGKGTWWSTYPNLLSPFRRYEVWVANNDLAFNRKPKKMNENSFFLVSSNINED